MSVATGLTPPAVQPDWQTWRTRLLKLTCLIVGTMMFYRGLLNLFGYPSEWVSLFPDVPIIGSICRTPAYWERWWLGPIFMGGVFGIALMWRNKRIGWWIFTALNFLVGYWFIFILEDIWQHHVLPHIVFSAVFLPFYPGMERTQWLSKARGHLLNPLASFALRLLQRPWFGSLIEGIPFLHTRINRLLINTFVSRARTRPHPFSTRSSYTSWASLTDRTWAGCHLGTSDIDQGTLPEWDGENGLRPLFQRPDGSQKLCPKSTVLFPAFAQYLTDGFLRTVSEENPDDATDKDQERRKRNSSNHEIDLCTLYGRNETQTRALRVQSPSPETRGFLRFQTVAGETYPPFLYNNGVRNEEFKELDTPLGLSKILKAISTGDEATAEFAKKQRDSLFAVGGDRVNSVPQVAMMNTLWLREHNRLAAELGRLHGDWDDDRVFETARNIVIVQFIKVVVEDYINHIAPFAVRLKADPSVAWKAAWNKANWITTEFSLLYRWHSLIPDEITFGETTWPVGPGFMMNNEILIATGLKRSFEDLSAQAAGALSPRNTNLKLLDVERDSIRQGRICELAPYNAYRKYLGRRPASDFSEISSDPIVVKTLQAAYGKGNVDKVDFFVGIFCEDRLTNSPLSEIILSFVALDAFSQALPNPLLSEHVFSKAKDLKGEHPTFTDYGMEQIMGCTSLRDIVMRNVEEPHTLGFVGMTQPDWRPS